MRLYPDLVLGGQEGQPTKKRMENKVTAGPGGLGLKSTGWESLSKAPRLVGHLKSQGC